MNRFKFIFLIISIMVALACIILIFRPLMISFFMVDANVDASPNLLVLLEGGGLVYSPTQERMNKLIDIYKRKPTNILVCSSPQYKEELISNLVSNGVLPQDIVKSRYVYDARGGTYNNVSEIMTTLKSNKEYNSIGIVTSPYHENRVQIIVKYLLFKSGINRRIKFSFMHIEDSDIYNTNNERYLNIIGHELLGTVWFYMQMVHGIFKNILTSLDSIRLHKK